MTVKTQQEISRIVDSHIQRASIDACDYAASVGAMLRNVGHMTWFKQGLAEWLGYEVATPVRMLKCGVRKRTRPTMGGSPA